MLTIAAVFQNGLELTKRLAMFVLGFLGVLVNSTLFALIVRYHWGYGWIGATFGALIVYSWFLDDIAEWVIRRRA